MIIHFPNCEITQQFELCILDGRENSVVQPAWIRLTIQWVEQYLLCLHLAY